jgi:Putative beta-barrel porin 2
MNKIVASVGLAALGASSINAVAQDVGAPPGKPWYIGASLRGFYDDNINTAHTDQVESFGMQLAPTVGVKWSDGATTVSASYLYNLYWYDKRPEGSTDNFDHVHTFTGLLNHAFNERYQIAVTDSFVYGQEPDSRAPGPLSTNERIPGDNMRNYGAIIFTAQLTPVFGTEVGYANTYVNYAGEFNNQLNPTPPNPPTTATFPIVASPSGALDRLENSAHIDARWTLKPTTIVLVGYMYQQIDYTGDEIIAGTITNTAAAPPDVRVILDPLRSDQRNMRSHIGYAGMEHVFNPNLKGSLRLGAQYATFPNDPANATQLSPYGTGSLSYTYRPKSHMDFGFSMGQNATDVTGFDASDFVLNTDTVLLYGGIYHQFVPHLFGSAIFTFQNSTYNGGSLDGESEQYYQVGLNLQYKFTEYFSADVGYNYDRTESEIAARQYDRNRFYLGVTGTY